MVITCAPSFSALEVRARSRGEPKTPVPHKLKGAVVILRDETVLLALRLANGLLGGLWEFPSAEVDVDSPEALVAAIEAEYRLKVSPIARLAEVRHAYTHFTLTETAWRCELIQKDENGSLCWVPLTTCPAASPPPA